MKVSKLKEAGFRCEPEVKIREIAFPDTNYYSLQSESCEYFKVYFNYLYYIGFSPFRLKSTINGCILHSNKYQKVLCSILHIFLIIIGVSLANEYSEMMHAGDLEDLNILPFQQVTIACMSGMPLIAIYLVWRKQEVIYKFMRNCQNMEFVRQKSDCQRKTQIKTCILYVVCIFSTILGVWTHAYNIITLFFTTDTSTEGILQIMNERFQQNFLFRNASLKEHPISMFADFPTTLSCTIYSLLCTYDHVIVSLFGVINFMAALTVRQLSAEFLRDLDSSSACTKVEEFQILNKFCYISNLLDLVNDFTGLSLLFTFISFIPIFSMQSVDAIYSDDWFTKLATLMLLFSSLAPTIVAADASTRFDNIRKWLLNRNFETDDKNAIKVSMIFTKLSNEPMGLNACGLYTVTYRFIGSSMGLLITYSTLAFQLRQTTKDICPTEFSSAAFHFIRIYSDILYYAGFSPYRFKYCDGRYIFHTNRMQKAICCIIHAICGSISLSLVRQYMEHIPFMSGNNGNENGQKLFGAATILFLGSHLYIFMFMIWRNQEAIKRFVIFSQPLQPSKTTNTWEIRKILVANIMCILTVLGGLLSHRGNNLLRLAFNGGLSNRDALKQMIGQFKYNFNMQNASDPITILDDPLDSFPDILSSASIVYCAFSLYLHVMLALFGVLPSLAGLTIRQLSLEFWNHLEMNQGRVDSENFILEQFFYISDLIDSFNDYIGLGLLVSLLTCVPLSTSSLSTAFGTMHIKDLGTAFLFATALCPLLVAAHASRRFDRFKDWLLRYEIDETNKRALKMNMILTKLSNDPVGVKGCGLFTITYGFIGTSLSVIVTYSIVALQMNVRTARTF